MKWDMKCGGQKNEMKYEIQCAKEWNAVDKKWNEIWDAMDKKWNGIWNAVGKEMKWNMKCGGQNNEMG